MSTAEAINENDVDARVSTVEDREFVGWLAAQRSEVEVYS